MIEATGELLYCLDNCHSPVCRAQPYLRLFPPYTFFFHGEAVRLARLGTSPRRAVGFVVNDEAQDPLQEYQTRHANVASAPCRDDEGFEAR